MRFVVTPVTEKPASRWIITHCVLCSEDPRWCPPTS